MQKLGDTIITDLGMDLLSSVNNGDDKITYTKTVLAADDLTQESDVDIQKTTSLTLIQQTTGTTVISRVDDTVNLGATFTNKEVTQDFDFYVIGWYAKGSAVITDERLFAITPSTVKQTMPAGKDGAATAAISPKYASALSRSATVSLNPDQAGTVTPEYVDQKIQQIISEGIVNAGSTLSESDNLDSFITTGYHLIKGSLPLSAPEGFSTNGQIIVYGNKDTTDGVTQVAYDDINGTSYVRSYNPTNNKWSDWDLVITKSQLNAVLPTDIARTGEDNDFKGKNTFETDPTDGAGNAYAKTVDVNQQLDKKVNIADMRKPASDVAGIEEVNAKQDKIGYTPADDSQVAHLSGANNFDTIPTVKNNPLLLASSLPSDLARTGQANTYTAAQTFSIAPIIKDASKDKGDNQAATMADLKSVENSAWIQLDATNGTDEIALCRVDGNKLWVVWAFERSGDNQSKSYSIGKVPQSIQGKRFSEFNKIFGGPVADTEFDTYYLSGGISISSNLIIASYSGYQQTMGWSVYGYFTFN
ncbi:hypothetical protein B9K02_00340 [Lentilactobacillus kefiri]|uniref:pyocin knob domain-containing protein n=1 Tax=Lentilactobacillus kefiri TaxID=33962 RepID=UPI000BA5C721|nr:pyocin knob domain-containing protein [Lentilactobacillus kefiri]PAK60562.1 hypothetical protein B9K02_00340 [Lentilactobacillus kefiri]